MIRTLATLAAAALLSTPALAAPCRDANGHYVKCVRTRVITHTRTTTVKKATGIRCKDANGRYAACGTRGAKPA